jgi:hypothetical protein
MGDSVFVCWRERAHCVSMRIKMGIDGPQRGGPSLFLCLPILLVSWNKTHSVGVLFLPSVGLSNRPFHWGNKKRRLSESVPPSLL